MMRKLLIVIVIIFLLTACGGSKGGDNALPTLIPTEDVNESPRTEATPDPGLPPTWTPVPAESEGHLFDVNGNDGTSGNVEIEGTRFVYTVQRGDTLGTIASRYGVSVSDLVALNDIDNPNVIEVGQQIIIPVSGE